MTTERPCFAAFHVEDLEEAGRFYREGVGIALERDQDPLHEETSWHDPYFHFALFPKEAPREPALGLFVEDLDVTHERLVAMGARVDRAPYVAPWGREARYLDPDGNLISLTERKTHHTRGA